MLVAKRSQVRRALETGGPSGQRPCLRSAAPFIWTPATNYRALPELCREREPRCKAKKCGGDRVRPLPRGLPRPLRRGLPRPLRPSLLQRTSTLNTGLFFYRLAQQTGWRIESLNVWPRWTRTQAQSTRSLKTLKSYNERQPCKLQP